MAYPPHALCQFGGKLDLHAAGDRGEIWSCGVRLKSAAGGFLDDPETFIDVQVPRIKAWFVANTSTMRTDASLEYVKINNIGADGHYTGGTTTERHFTPVFGAGHSATYPSYLTVAWSWTTGISRGLAHAGRVFPPNGFVYSGGSAITSGDRNEHAAAARALILACNGTLPETEGAVPVVVSGLRGGAIHDITGVRVGDVVDVQRKRRNASAETYAALAI